MEELKLKDIQMFFGMTTGQMAAEWKVLTPEERDYFKDAVAAEVGKVVVKKS